MNRIASYRVALAALLACTLPARGQPPADARAQAVVAASRDATGGGAWDRFDGCYEEGTHGDGAITYRTWFSLRRYGMRVEGRRGGTTRVRGFNGTASWQTNESGGVDISRDEGGLREALTTFYISSNAFFFPDRFPAEFSYLREAADAGRTFDVVRIAPSGGHALDYWFDRDSHYLIRVVDNRQSPPIVVEAGDYRRSGDIAAAFSLTVRGPDGRVMDRGAVVSIACGPVDAALFDPPAGH
jgi:hypothetical protein